ncbi:MAG: SIMPL domain-containing protein [Bryobacteraceae bacterium]|jgi:uncharacterized protein YggE
MSRFAAFFLVLPMLQAQTKEPFVRASGEATISAKPDEARIQIGVITPAKTAEAAAGENANQTSAVLAELRKNMAAGSELRTLRYSIAPQYRYPKAGGTPVIDGYIANNTVNVTTRDLASVGKLIDIASRDGANTIRSIDFTVHDDRAIRAQALREATENARANAEAMVSGVGAKLGRLLTVESSVLPQTRPLPQFQMRAANQQAPTEIEPGSVDVRASVTVSFEIVQ